MKTIGLIGGMSWESSILYYEILNNKIKERLGGLHSAKCIMYSLDFEPIKHLQHEGKWDEAAALLVEAAQRMETAGADFIVLCTNTMHKIAQEIESNISIPFLHIADATAEAIIHQGIKKVGLLATQFTMEEQFYKGRLQDKYKLQILIPDLEEREIIHNIIYEELCRGEIKDSSKKQYVKIIENLVQSGAEAIILGCTEIGLLIKEEDCNVPIFDTTLLHAVSAVEYALEGSNILIESE